MLAGVHKTKILDIFFTHIKSFEIKSFELSQGAFRIFMKQKYEIRKTKAEKTFVYFLKCSHPCPKMHERSVVLKITVPVWPRTMRTCSSVDQVDLVDLPE
jgi:hypothetical protein